MATLVPKTHALKPSPGRAYARTLIPVQPVTMGFLGRAAATSDIERGLARSERLPARSKLCLDTGDFQARPDEARFPSPQNVGKPQSFRANSA